MENMGDDKDFENPLRVVRRLLQINTLFKIISLTISLTSHDALTIVLNR